MKLLAGPAGRDNVMQVTQTAGPLRVGLADCTRMDAAATRAAGSRASNRSVRSACTCCAAADAGAAAAALRQLLAKS